MKLLGDGAVMAVMAVVLSDVYICDVLVGVTLVQQRCIDDVMTVVMSCDICDASVFMTFH